MGETTSLIEERHQFKGTTTLAPSCLCSGAVLIARKGATEEEECPGEVLIVDRSGAYISLGRRTTCTTARS